jgi:hypothetical protein
MKRIQASIFMIRGLRVMLDKDLAELYGIGTKALKQAVKRNVDRFPSDFMFVLNEQEVAMLSSVLRSRRAIEVNIAIMRVFVRLREMMATHKELALKLRELEGRIQDHDEQIVAIFEAIRQLMTPPDQPIPFAVYPVEDARSLERKIPLSFLLSPGGRGWVRGNLSLQ